ncbi:hypothetical protein [Mesonia sp. K7]|uniref:hypothetical protein n=1 Tax=Mesonia sp. K7 TaxID=2218606 RepID=UPI000DAA7180|nr:hypothetical protein [Mesonia sp. K7]PZD78224.1 hypothetical protein DNG35_05860 [Mesonia sp. K7]
MSKPVWFILGVIGVCFTLIILLFAYKIEIQHYFYAKDFIYWSDDVRIDYDDFEGEVDINSNKKISNYQALYLKAVNIHDKEVYAVFDKSRSWIKDTIGINFEYEMRLLQIRFDLYEVHARKYQKKLDEIKNIEQKSFSDLEIIGDSIYEELQVIEDKLYDDSLPILERINTWKPTIDNILRQTPKK